MSNLTIKPQQIYRILLSPARTEPAGNPGMYRFLRGLVVVQGYLIAILLGLSILVSFVFADKNIYHMIVLDREGAPRQVAQLVPLTEPNLTRTAIINMVMHITTRVQTYGFHNADERLLEVRRLFTPEAWISFAKGHLEPGQLERFKQNQQIRSTIATKGAVIVEEGIKDDRYQWVIEVPTLSSYLAGSDAEPVPSLLTITLIRAPTTDYPEGVAIDGWKESSGNN